MGSWNRHRYKAEQLLAYLAKEPLNMFRYRGVARLSRQIGAHVPPRDWKMAPIVFFNASTRTSGLSLNGAFALLANWALGFAGRRVVHLACRGGLNPCLLGTRPEALDAPPPCPGCISQSRRLYAGTEVRWMTRSGRDEFPGDMGGMKVEALQEVEYGGLPLGGLVLPSVRWILRRHHLGDDAATCRLFRSYIGSAWHVARVFEGLADEVKPCAVVVFNGIFYPEAVVRRVAERRGIRVVTHEVGVRPFSAFFTGGEATAYPIELPDGFELTPLQNQELDRYLAERFKGRFTMAGIRFWPRIAPLGRQVLDRLSSFKRMVPVFSNVVFDTSQPHANVVFSDMFEWLDQMVEIMKCHPETLFVIRAHPDEYRRGKRSRETVAEWVADRAVENLPNLVFIDADDPASSYELIERAHVVMVYNSTIGLEAAMMGKAVVCGGKARFTPFDTAYQPASKEAFREQVERLLSSETVDVPGRFRVNARRFMYYQLFRASLSFADYLEEDRRNAGYVRLKEIPWETFRPSHSPTLETIVGGIAEGKRFVVGG
jgi:hypothetical protein